MPQLLTTVLTGVAVALLERLILHVVKSTFTPAAA